MFVDADSLVEFPVGQTPALILIHRNAHMHSYSQFHNGNIQSSLPNVWKLQRKANKRNLVFEGQLLRVSHAANRTECSQMFWGQHYLVVEPQAAEFTVTGAVLRHSGLNSQSSPS